MSKTSRKVKSDFVFWGVFILLIAFLFFTPYGEKTRIYVSSLILTSPTSQPIANGKTVLEEWYLTGTDNINLRLQECSKPILINIWATWCSPCRSELPSLVELENKYRDQITFLFISPTESIDVLNKFASNEKYNTVFFASNSAIPKALQISSYPTTFILDENKKIILKSVGAHNWNSENVHNTIDQILTDQTSN